MAINPNLINNLLDVFAEAEKVREKGIMPGLNEQYKQFGIKYFVSYKEVEHIKNMFHRIGRYDESESLKLLNISPAERYIFNQSLKDMVEEMVMKMIQDGVIVLEIKDSDYGKPSSELTLTVRVVNPRPTIRRIDIQRKDKD